jgi:hypothetical protein
VHYYLADVSPHTVKAAGVILLVIGIIGLWSALTGGRRK